MRPIPEVLEELKSLPPQTKVEVMRGFNIRLKKGGIPVATLHYSAHPDRDPAINPSWFATERANYSSQGAWDREQEIQDLAGGGELVFADMLITHWKKIVISDPKWRPNPEWDVYGGFDHGKTNPTTLGRMYVDFFGNKYCCGEYYQPGMEIWQHAAEMKKMADIRRIQACWADRTIFDDLHQQTRVAGDNQGKTAKSTNDLYVDEGIELFTKYVGDRSDWSSAQRVLAHWKDLDKDGVMPKLYIVCRFPDADTPRPGLHNWDSPNLLWEMMRTRKKKLTAQQLMAKNPSEEIVDKDNHARDAMLKYCLMNMPEPTEKTKEMVLAERLAHIPKTDPTSRMIVGERVLAELEDDEDGEDIPMGRPRRR